MLRFSPPMCRGTAILRSLAKKPTATLCMYRAVVEESISAHRGHVFSSAGDGVVAEFPSIVEAIRCAVEGILQRDIDERRV